MDHLTSNSLLSPHQSARCKHDSTETALFLCIHDHLINAVGSQKVSCLCFLDLPAALDTILTMTSWSPASHPGSVSMALSSAGSCHICQLVASVSNVTIICLPRTHSPVVFPRAPFSVYHSFEYSHFWIPKSSSLCRWHSALILSPTWIWLQYWSLSKCCNSNFLLDDCGSSDLQLLEDWISAHWSQ